MARHHQLEDRGKQLLVAQSLLAVSCADERTDEVVPRIGLLRSHEVSEHAYDDVGGALCLFIFGVVDVGTSNWVNARRGGPGPQEGHRGARR